MAQATAEKKQKASETEAAAAESKPNDVKIEDIGPARKKITITVPAESVTAKLEETLVTMTSEAALPGFRKGRAPRALLEKRFGSTMKQETKNQLIGQAYTTAIEEHKLRVVGEPEPSDEMKDLQLESGKPLSFSFEVEVVPEFQLPKLEGVEIRKPTLEIEDKHIDEEMKRQLVRFGTPARIDGDFTGGDRLVGQAKVIRNDETEPFFHNDSVLVIYPPKEDGGRGQVLGVMVEDLEAKLKGAKVGDTVELETTGPEAHEREDIRGAKLRISYHIRAAERITPATVESMVEQFSLGTPENLREQVKLGLEQRRDQEQAAAMREQVNEYLLANTELALPEKLSEAQVTRNLERHRLELMYRGQTPEQVENHLAEIRAESEQATRDRLKLTFILNRLAEHYEISVSEQEVNGAIAMMAAQRGERPAKLRAELAQAGRLPELANGIRETKAVDRVVASAKVSAISAEEWNKFATSKRAERDAKRASTRKVAAGGKKPVKAASEQDAEGDEKAASRKKPAEKKSASKPEARSEAKKPAPKKKSKG
jgi:trigger factor